MGYSTTLIGIYCDWRGCHKRLDLTLLSRSYFRDRDAIEAKAKAAGWSCWMGTTRRGRRREFCESHGPADPSKARRIW